MTAWIADRLRQAGRDLGYLTLGGLTATLAFGVWVAGVSVTLSLAVFVVGLLAVVLVAAVFRAVAELDRRNTAWFLRASVAGAYRPHGGAGFLGHVRATLADPQTWRDFAWLVVHSVLGFAFGVLAVTAVAYTAGLIVAPTWYWAVPDGIDLLGFTVDELGEAVLVVPGGLLLIVPTVALLRGMAVVESRLAVALLGGDPSGATHVERPPYDGAALPWHVGVATAAGLVCTLIWGLTGADAFWPAWVWLGLAVTVALHVFAVRLTRAGDDAVAALRARAELCVVIEAVCVAVWALAGAGYFWPVWPALGMAVALAGHALFAWRHRLPWVRERKLVARVDELTRTRRGALDVEAAELRRIERDLHDGAQARLVALSIQLGRAEERLADQPEVAHLVRQARGEASAAIAELRDLARGIAPPVLTDRGLAAAVEAVGRRAPGPVTVEAELPSRLPAVVETAAYFVVAEGLTNVAKHAPQASARVGLRLDEDVLVIEVVDDGPGGADPAGGGLTGLRRRVEALDGTLRVTSPPGGGTTIRAELPCAS